MIPHNSIRDKVLDQEAEREIAKAREQCVNQVFGIHRFCSYDPENNKKCPEYKPVRLHTYLII